MFYVPKWFFFSSFRNNDCCSFSFVSSGICLWALSSIDIFQIWGLGRIKMGCPSSWTCFNLATDIVEENRYLQCEESLHSLWRRWDHEVVFISAS
jgi:hypothetical protein